MSFKLMLASMAGAFMAAPGRSRPVEAPIVAAHSSHLALRAAPINPGWIIRGTPVARIADHSTSSDEASLTAVWDCTAGEFRWYFYWDETVVIQDGEVHVTAQDGSVRILKSGDIAYFRAGTWSTWRIDSYVRKVAFLRKPFPEPIATLYRMRNAFRGKADSALG